MSSQTLRECWYRYIRLSEEEKKDLRRKLDLITAEELGIDIPSSDGVDGLKRCGYSPSDVSEAGEWNHLFS